MGFSDECDCPVCTEENGESYYDDYEPEIDDSDPYQYGLIDGNDKEYLSD